MENESRKFLDEWFEGWRRTDLLYDRFLKRYGLNLTTYFVLELLHHHPEGVEPAVIAEKVFVLRQTVTVVLNEFENADLSGAANPGKITAGSAFC